jgi:hypothetical protein
VCRIGLIVLLWTGGCTAPTATPGRFAAAVTEVSVEATTYEVTGYPFHDENRYLFTIRVERRAEGSWAVMRRSDCWNRRTKAWDYEPLSSSRTAAFKRTHRFPLDQALAIARELALKLTVNGWTLEAAIANAEAREAS